MRVILSDKENPGSSSSDPIVTATHVAFPGRVKFMWDLCTASRLLPQHFPTRTEALLRELELEAGIQYRTVQWSMSN